MHFVASQVGDFTYAELMQLKWSSGDRIMRVADAVQMTSPYVLTVTLDVKTYDDSQGRPLDELQVADAVVRLVHDTGCRNCLIWAKSDTVVERVKVLSPAQQVQYVVTY